MQIEVTKEEKGGGLYCVDLHGLFYKCFYLGENKIVSHIPVRIKCRKGCIQIEKKEATDEKE